MKRKIELHKNGDVYLNDKFIGNTDYCDVMERLKTCGLTKDEVLDEVVEVLEEQK
jgi:hypothetical protein